MRGALENVGARAAAQLLVLLDVDVDGQHPHHLGHDEGQSSEVKGPTVGVLPLLVLVLLRRDVAQCRRDVDDHADDVTQTCDNKETWDFKI